MRMHYFRSKHDVTADWLALLLLIRKAPLSTLARLRGRVDFPQSIFRWVGHVARMGRGTCTQGVRRNAIVRDLLGDTLVDRRIILKRIFIKRIGKRKWIDLA